MGHLITVSAGTYQYPFDRLVDWVDEWIDQSSDDVEIIIQYGHSKKPRSANAHQIIPFKELSRFFANSDLIVTHGGPSTIMDARECGKIPIVIPRRPEFGEHVDGHQVKFAEYLKKNKVAWVAESKENFFELLETGLTSPEQFLSENMEVSIPCIENFGSIVDTILEIETPIEGIKK